MNEFNLNELENIESNYNSRTKKIIKICIWSAIALALILFIYFSINPLAAEIEYVVISESEKTAGIVMVRGNVSNIRIPETKDGYTVVAFLFSHMDIHKIHVPDTVKYIVPQDNDVEFIINDTNPYISISDRLLFNKDKTELINCLYLEDVYYRDHYTYNINYYKEQYENDYEDAYYYNNDKYRYYEDEYNKYKELNSIKIPATVTKINDAFKQCTGFCNIEVDENNPSFSSENGALYNKDKTVVIKGFGDNIKIGSSVKKIEDYAFKDCNFSEINVPFGVEEIGNNAFENCRNLKNVNLSDSIVIIGNNAFKGSSPREINIPDSVITIGNSAFSGCYELQSVKLPAKITELKNGVFKDCSELNSINIPAGLVNIDWSVFEGCAKFNNVQVDPANPKYAFSDGILWDLEKDLIVHHPYSAKNEINIPYGITVIRFEAFGDNGYRSYENVKKLNIPSSVMKIESGTFKYFDNLGEVIIPASVTEIEGWTFINLPNIIFPDSGGFELTDPEPSTITLYVESGSYAEQYAKENNIKFVTHDGNFFPYSVTFSNLNIEEYTVDVTLSITPKDYKPSDTATFNLGEYSSDMAYNGVLFTGVATVSLFESEYGKPTVTVTNNGVNYSEEIDNPVSLRNYLSDYFGLANLGTYEVETHIVDEERGQMGYKYHNFRFDNNLSVKSARIFVTYCGEEDYSQDLNVESYYDWGIGWVDDPDDSEPYLIYLEITNENGFIYRWFLGESPDPKAALEEGTRSGDLSSHGIVYDKTGTKIIYTF